MISSNIKIFPSSNVVQFLASLLRTFAVWIVLPLFLTSAIVIWFFLNSPASYWLDSFQDKKASIQLVMARGSLIKGTGLLALVPQNEKTPAIIIPGRFSWHVDVSKLFLGRLVMSIAHTRAIANPVKISFSASEFLASAINIRIPVGIFQALGVPFSSLKMVGNIDIAIEPLKIVISNFLDKKPVLDINNFSMKILISLQDRRKIGFPTNIGKYIILSNSSSKNLIGLSVKSLAGPLIVEGDLNVNSTLASYSILLKDDPVSEDQNGDLIKSLGGKYVGQIKLPFTLKSN